MSLPSSHPAQTYAALRPGTERPGPDRRLVAFHSEEAERLSAIKAALWQAFLSAPSAAIPSSLVDLAHAYASLLRLELSLKGTGAAPSVSATVRPAAAPPAKTAG